MPERFESDVFWREDVKLMKDAFCVAWLKVKLIDQDRVLIPAQIAHDSEIYSPIIPI
jgi:hypothetical protein